MGSENNMNLFGFDTDKAFDYENGFYLTSDPRRLGKLLAHFEIYQRIVGLPGAVVECGVFKGPSLIRFATFRDLLESSFSRKIIGFDSFGSFPSQANAEDDAYARKHEQFAGAGISVAELKQALALKKIENYELIEGDICKTVPDYAEQHPELRIALLHVDVDVYEPSMVALQTLYRRVVPGGVVIFDDYGTVAGETRAVDEFFAGQDILLQKLPISHIPAFLVKKAGL